MNTLETTMRAFGCHDVVLFDKEPTSRHLNYLDLLKPAGAEKPKVDAVAEFQTRPMLYIVSAERRRNLDAKSRLDLQCLLANRGESAYLGLIAPGELNVYPINLNRSVLDECDTKTVKSKDPEAKLFFQDVTTGTFKLRSQPEEPDYVFKAIFNLISKSSEELIKYGINPLDVLSLLGRALFFRFLRDRKIVRSNELVLVCPEAKSPRDCFANIKNSVATCLWLDDTFNGDLLPFSSDYESVFKEAEKKTEGKIFLHLRAILEGWEHADKRGFQVPIDWGTLDFAHIPIGVLSQVYEHFSREWDSQSSKQTSAYYTPKNIAACLVDYAFEGVDDKKNAKILDPSCGAGIFLAMAFRKLFAAHWESDGKRPNTEAIQSILYNQLCGFDISEPALRLAALSLYLTAIELNWSPHPPVNLKFPKPLRDKVLYNHRRFEDNSVASTKDFVLGSLHSDISEDFNGDFDMVIGNPPWTSVKKSEDIARDKDNKTDVLEEQKERGLKESKEPKNINQEFTDSIRKILADRKELENINSLPENEIALLFEMFDLEYPMSYLFPKAQQYENPDNNPDLPFLWKSTQWAKPGGIIAMALPGRIFLKQSKPGIQAFHAVLRGLEINGILNGSNLSDTPVWPGMNRPFMLFFASNRVPESDHHFHFITPHCEQKLNARGRIRIDWQAAQPVTVCDIEKKSWLLKALAIGTLLDVEVMDKLDALNWPSVQSYWQSQGLYSGAGYILSPENPKQYDASFMYDLPDFVPHEQNGFSIDISVLDKFKHTTALRPRSSELYKPPFVIIPESPGGSQFSPKSLRMRDSVVFRSSYYGFSAHGIQDAGSATALLHLLTHSDLFSFHVLMTSSKMGAERRTFLKSDVENFPFPKINELSNSQKNKAILLSKQLENDSDKPWENINRFLFDCYGLNEHDRQVVKDTLAVALPFKKERERANMAPTKNERDSFYKELIQCLEPYFYITDETVLINELEFTKHNNHSSWYLFDIHSTSMRKNLTSKAQAMLISKITEQADKTGCSRVVVHERERLLLGIIGQYRYWTLTRARLCALDIMRRHLDVFPIRRY